MSKRAIIYGILLLGGALLVHLAMREEQPAPSARAPVDDAAAPRRVSAPLPRGVWNPSTDASGPLAAISGTVKDARQGQPISSAQLVFKSTYGRAEALTNDAGRYELQLQPGRYHVEVASAGFFSAAKLPVVQVGEGEQHGRLDFVLYRGARVSGRVVDNHGRALPSAKVSVHDARSVRGFAIPKQHTAESDVRGRFSLIVPPARVVLLARGRRGVTLSDPLFLRAGRDVSGVQLMIGAGLSIAGKVVGPERQQVKGARVFLSDALGTRSIRCDEEGRFSTANLTAGKKMLQAMASGYSPSRVVGTTVGESPRPELQLALTKRRSVAGSVVDSQRQPIASARVTVNVGSATRRIPHLLEPLRATTDSMGRFEISGVSDLPLVVTAEDSASNARVRRSGVPPDSRGLLLVLQATGGIVGRVTDGTTGRPIQRFSVAARQRHFAFEQRVVSKTGQYGLHNLPAGRYQLTFAAYGYGPQLVERVDVVAGSLASSHATLAAGGSIVGVVVDPRGMPIAGAQVVMETGAAGEPTLTDAEGRFRIKDVARGRRSLTVSHRAYDTRISSGVSVFAGKVAAARVELSPRSGKGAIRLSGIGVVISRAGERPAIQRVLPHSPAAVADLRARDVILAVDGQPTAKTSFSAAVEAIRGLVGTPVRLRLARGSGEVVVDVIRAEVSIPK